MQERLNLFIAQGQPLLLDKHLCDSAGEVLLLAPAKK
jgi:hypothetical protein